MFPVGDDNTQRRTFPAVTFALIGLNVLVLPGRACRRRPIHHQLGLRSLSLFRPAGRQRGDHLLRDVHAWRLAPPLRQYAVLWIFGDKVEDRFGHLKFLIFYLLAGIAATFAQYAISPESGIPNVGASGAIAGVLGSYILMFPQARVNVLLGRQIVAMPAVIVLGFWIVLQLVSGVGTIGHTDESADVGGVAYMAHIGGFVAGLLMTFLFRDSSSSSSAT